MGSKKKNTGKCRLCLKEPIPLVRSHFYSKFSYECYGTNAVAITAHGERPLHEYIRHPIFCGKCDNGHFNKYGENYISKVGYRRRDNFPLRDLLMTRPHFSLAPGVRGYDISSIAEVNGVSLIYFALSLVYRAAIWRSLDPNVFKVRLDDNIKEELRSYLCKETDLPQDTVVQLIVVDPPEDGSQVDLKEVGVFPYQRQVDPNGPLEFSTYRPFEFLICGLLFHVSIGDRAPASVKQESLHPGGRIYRVPSNKLKINQLSENLVGVALSNMLWTPSGPQYIGRITNGRTRFFA